MSRVDEATLPIAAAPERVYRALVVPAGLTSPLCDLAAVVER